MDKQTEINIELKTISPFLAGMEKVNVFQIPKNYFSDLEAKILTNIFLQQDEKNHFQKVPDGYFNSLSDKIISRIKEEKDESVLDEIKSISPALFYLKEEPVFTVPERYFDDLSDQILDRIKGKKTKVISISSAKKWWKYAAAAVVAGAVTVSSLQIFNQSSVSENKKETITASSTIPGYIQESSKYKTAEELKAGIASLNDEEIINYLQATGSILDEESITKNLNTTQLPDVNEYLIDENTLNNFLNSDAQSLNKNTQ